MIDTVKSHVADNKNIYKNGAVVIGGYLVTRYLIKKFALTPVEYVSGGYDKDLNINTKLSAKDKTRIKNYFEKIELFLDSYFLKKYSSYFKCITQENKEELKVKHEVQDLNEIIFPVSYYKIHENSSLVEFLKEMCQELNIECNEADYENLIKNIKHHYKIKSHKKVLDELKEYIAEEDYPNWQKLYDSNPITILN